MFGVPLDGSFGVMCDNQEEVNNTILPQYTLGQKQNTVNYHALRKEYEAGILQVGKKDMETIFSDLMTNILS